MRHTCPSSRGGEGFFFLQRALQRPEQYRRWEWDPEMSVPHSMQFNATDIRSSILPRCVVIMPTRAFYNEIDPYCCAWLSNLMDAGHITPGVICDRSIEDISPKSLLQYDRVHMFAGIAGWELALKHAGWGNRRVWTGSCPCQPFSAAGKGAGFDDQRHLWPAWFHLIRECRPSVIFGEQVASKDAEPWVDLVHADLEGVGYAFGCVPFPAAGVGAPHIRDRNYWAGIRLVDSSGARSTAGLPASTWRHEGLPGIADDSGREQPRAGFGSAAGGPGHGGMADANGRHAGAERQQRSGEQRQQPADSGAFRLAHSDGSVGGQGRAIDGGRDSRGDALARSGSGGSVVPDGGRPGPLHGFWRAADWLLCRDGKWRPVSPSPQPMVDGLPISLGSLRADRIEAIKEEVNAWELETGLSHREALRDLWNAAVEASPRLWTPGGIPGLHEAPFLLSFVRQLAEQGWGIPECLSVQGKEVSAGRMRVLWSEVGTPCPPHQLKLEGQPSGEYPDALRLLSSILARHAHQAWEVAHSAYAETRHPLGKGLHGRIGRLRAYGNAIVPQEAAEFVMSLMDIQHQRISEAA